MFIDRARTTTKSNSQLIMETDQTDLRRPLLEGDMDEVRAAAILHEWNASVAAFVAENGGDENASCFCDSITPEMSSITPDPNSHLDVSAMTNDEDETDVDLVISPLRACLSATNLVKMCTSTLLPDGERSHENNVRVDNEGNDEEIEERMQDRDTLRLGEGPWGIKFLKFVVLTFLSIALVRKTVVAMRIQDMDSSLTLTEIWRYESESILRDLLFFFVVGRMHQRTGIDTIEWVAFGLLANVYFESQNLFPWMQHSATPYEMHCLWPWQLWVFAVIVVAGIGGLVLAHLVTAYRQKRFWHLVGEFLFCIVAFILPVATSPYAHFHHWFAGWFFGMHANLHDTWWSRACMAYCWGMYVNGVAVYGRDPLLTCDYAHFLARDQGCPISVTLEEYPPPEHGGLFPLLGEIVFVSDDLPDWRNCSSSGYHP